MIKRIKQLKTKIKAWCKLHIDYKITGEYYDYDSKTNTYTKKYNRKYYIKFGKKYAKMDRKRR